MQLIDIVAALLFLSGLVVAGVFRASRSVRTEGAYLLAERKTGLFALTATLVMTEFNTTTLVAFSAVGYVAGVWGLSLPLVFLAGLGFYTWTVARKWKRFNAFSVAEMFSKRYGIWTGRLAAIALLLAMLGFSATYIKSLWILFSPLLPGLNQWTISGLITLLIVGITLRGGLVAVIRTDVFSFIVVLIVVPLMLLFAALSNGSAPFERLNATFTLNGSFKALPPAYVVSLIVLCMFTYITAPWYGQKIFAANNERTALLAVGFSAVLVFVLYGAAVLAVAFVRVKGIALSNPETALPLVVNTMLPTGLRGLAYGVFFAAGATTLAGVWSAMSTMFIGDFLKKQEDGNIKRGVLLSVGFALCSYLLANTLVDAILQKLILANIPVAALAFALLAGFYWKRASTAGANAGIVMGIGWGIFTYLYLGEAGMYTWYWAMYGIPLIFVVGAVVSLLMPGNAEEHKRRADFFDSMATENLQAPRPQK